MERIVRFILLLIGLNLTSNANAQLQQIKQVQKSFKNLSREINKTSKRVQKDIVKIPKANTDLTITGRVFNSIDSLGIQTIYDYDSNQIIGVTDDNGNFSLEGHLGQALVFKKDSQYTMLFIESDEAEIDVSKVAGNIWYECVNHPTDGPHRSEKKENLILGKKGAPAHDEKYVKKIKFYLNK